MDPVGFYHKYHLARLQPQNPGRFPAPHSGVISQPNSSFTPSGGFPGTYDIINTTPAREQPATIFAVDEPMSAFNAQEVKTHMQDTSEPNLTDILGTRTQTNRNTHCVGCHEALPAGRKSHTHKTRHRQMHQQMIDQYVP